MFGPSRLGNLTFSPYTLVISPVLILFYGDNLNHFVKITRTKNFVSPNNLDVSSLSKRNFFSNDLVGLSKLFRSHFPLVIPENSKQCLLRIHT